MAERREAIDFNIKQPPPAVTDPLNLRSQYRQMFYKAGEDSIIATTESAGDQLLAEGWSKTPVVVATKPAKRRGEAA